MLNKLVLNSLLFNAKVLGLMPYGAHLCINKGPSGLKAIQAKFLKNHRGPIKTSSLAEASLAGNYLILLGKVLFQPKTNDLECCSLSFSALPALGLDKILAELKQRIWDSDMQNHRTNVFIYPFKSQSFFLRGLPITFL
uniref:Uncharacterized protein n=1 Tax=Micrurus surinamensis TaxID=129470 RepID=A0A2D4PD99_MICSU